MSILCGCRRCFCFSAKSLFFWKFSREWCYVYASFYKPCIISSTLLLCQPVSLFSIWLMANNMNFIPSFLPFTKWKAQWSIFITLWRERKCQKKIVVNWRCDWFINCLHNGIIYWNSTFNIDLMPDNIKRLATKRFLGEDS